jgi:hypothetical protein
MFTSSGDGLGIAGIALMLIVRDILRDISHFLLAPPDNGLLSALFPPGGAEEFAPVKFGRSERVSMLDGVMVAVAE